MKESVEMLLKKMSGDKAFAEKILSQTEKEKVIEIALEEGIALTLEDIDEANVVIAKALEKQNEGELSEEELENVAGGFLDVVVLTILGAVAFTVSGGVSAGLSVTITLVASKEIVK